MKIDWFFGAIVYIYKISGITSCLDLNKEQQKS